MLAVLLLAPTTVRGEPKRGEVVEVIARDGWRARPPAGDLVKHVIKRLTVHHSGAPLRENRRAPDRLRSAQHYHQRVKGWPDIAYHFLIDLDGNLYEGRPLDARGDSHTPYDTTGHFLVCVIGDYDRQLPSEPQLAALTRILAFGASRFAVSPATIRGHRDHARTSCPGKHLQASIADGRLGARVEALLRAGPIRLALISGAEARRRVEAIRARSAADPAAAAPRGRKP